MNLLQTFSVILTIFATSEALICYTCRFCDDIFQDPNIREVDCTSELEKPSCEKIVYELNNSTRGVIVRRCQFTIYLANISSEGEFIYGDRKNPVNHIQEYFLEITTKKQSDLPYVTRISVFHCSSNYCNSTSTISELSSIILIFILTFLFYSDSY